MNLNYTLKQIAEITNGQLIGDEALVVKQIVIDSRNPIIGIHTLFIALKGNKTDGHNYCHSFVKNGGELLLVNEVQKLPNCNQIVVNDVLIAIQLIAKHHREQFKIPVIGITGSNGKTTVKEWLFHVLKHKFIVCRSPKSYNSQLGVALSVLELNHTHTIAIFEAGVSKVGEMELLEQLIQPTIGIFTGIGDAHQQYFNSLIEKQNEKYKLFKNVNYIVSNPDSLTDIDIPFSDLASKQNAYLVYETALQLHLSESEVKYAMLNLPSISMRMERMIGKNGNVIINDTYTLDEKSLEIGVNYLSQVSVKNNRDNVLIIAPHPDSILSEKMIDLLNSSVLNKVILIGKLNSNPIGLTNATAYFDNVNEYIKESNILINSTILITGARVAKLEKIVSLYLVKKHITKLKINLSTLGKNVNFYRSKIKKDTLILAMVKAQSYGGGITEIARFLETQHINYFGVAYADEGVTLRDHNIKLPILVMNPELDAFDDIIENELEPSIYSLELLDSFINTLIRRNIIAYPIHIKLDTGMNRLGFVESELNELISHIKAQPEVYVKSVFSHLSVADNVEEEEFTNQQINLFKTFSNQFKTNLGYDFIEHIANSAATLNYPNSHFDMVRLGIGMYGLMKDYKDDLEPVLSFETQISQIKNISKEVQLDMDACLKLIQI